MQAAIFLVVYILVFVLMVIGLVKCLKAKLKWKTLIVFEIISVISSFFMYIYFEKLPGYGFMPGLSYLGEILFSAGAALLYSIFFIITIIAALIKCRSKKPN